MKRNRVLVTGGAGFIGSHLCEELLNKGNDVVCMGNLFTGQKDNIRHLMDNSYFEFIRQDVLKDIHVEEVYGNPEVHPPPEDYRGCVNFNGIRAEYP